jgi:hypothetical protein
MQAMVEMGFEVLITFDQNLPYQQKSKLPVAIGFANSILKTLTTLQPGQLVRL